MRIVTRLRVPPGEQEVFATAARQALEALSVRPGYLAGELGRAVDDQDLWLLSSLWEGVGAYRRGLSAYDAKIALAPLMTYVVNEPSAYALVARVEGKPEGGEVTDGR